MTRSLALLLAFTAACAHPARTHVPGLEAVADRPILVVGELHGTAETPAAVGAIVRELATGPVAVGLEVSQSEDARIEAFLASPGDEASRAALVAGPFWHHPLRDGRDSQAMLALLEELRGLRASHHDVVVVPFDVRDERADEPGIDRDRVMAESILAARKRRPGARMVVLTGNWHSRTASEPGGAPMTTTLRKAEPSLVALRAAYVGGSAWLCEDDGACKPRKLFENDDRGGLSITLGGVKDHDGALHVGPATASPPVVPIGK